MTDTPETPLIEDPRAPEIFADSLVGMFNFNGNLRLTLEAARAAHHVNPAPVARVVVGRVIMPLAAAENMARGILDFIAQQRRQAEPAPAPPTVPPAGGVH
jgi:hypothetical protein